LNKVYLPIVNILNIIRRDMVFWNTLYTAIDGLFTGNLHSALHDYELLDHTSFRHHIRKRDLYSRDPDVREVEYNSFGRLSVVTALSLFVY